MREKSRTFSIKRREPPAFLAHQAEVLGLFVRGADPAEFEALGQKPDRGDGRAQFVGNARDELALHPRQEFLAMERAPGGDETDQRGGRGHGDEGGEPIGAGALTREQQGRIIEKDGNLEHAETGCVMDCAASLVGPSVVGARSAFGPDI
jgi:hypothetical protein